MEFPTAQYGTTWAEQHRLHQEYSIGGHTYSIGGHFDVVEQYCLYLEYSTIGSLDAPIQNTIILIMPF